jgi:hypothetical protein
LEDRQKLQRFLCGCCRLIWDSLPDVAKNALRVAEAYAEGSVLPERITEERVKLWQFLGKDSCNFSSPEVNAVRAVICCLYEDIPDDAYGVALAAMDFCNGVRDETPAQLRLLHAIYTSP